MASDSSEAIPPEVLQNKFNLVKAYHTDLVKSWNKAAGVDPGHESDSSDDEDLECNNIPIEQSLGYESEKEPEDALEMLDLEDDTPKSGTETKHRSKRRENAVVTFNPDSREGVSNGHLSGLSQDNKLRSRLLGSRKGLKNTQEIQSPAKEAGSRAGQSKKVRPVKVARSSSEDDDLGRTAIGRAKKPRTDRR
ncbi:MAG: hypothetical protein M1814_000289 [Vezdaea aestivalis]|nr:MAG: hypothetical protein M1814_000289 [Vezdaea aestivalis]